MQESICYIIVKCSCGPLIVWEFFSWSEVEKLVDITGIINADKYISILNENLEEASIKKDHKKEFLKNLKDFLKNLTLNCLNDLTRVQTLGTIYKIY